MADDGWTRTHKAALALVVLGFLGFGGALILEREVWGPALRPLVILGGSGGAWRAFVDGAPAECAPFGPVAGESPTMGCVLHVEAGAHRLEVQDETGSTVHEASVTIASGTRSYAWAPEVPLGRCLVVEETRYAERTVVQTQAIIDSVTGFSSGPRSIPLGVGFHDLGVIHAWFSEPPAQVQSREDSTVRRALRLRPC
jgi:hypothetical protein